MKVKIVSCSSDRAWYKDKIGEVFEVFRFERGNWISVYAEESAWGLVLKADTVPVNEIKYELESNVRCDTCVTSCKHKKNTMVGSVGCSKCEYKQHKT